MILVAKLVQPVNTIKEIKAVVPPRAEYEPGFVHWVNRVRNISKQTSAPITFYSTELTGKRIARVFKESKASMPVKYNLFEDWEDFLILGRDIVIDDLLVVVSARSGSVSYHSYLPNVPKQLAKHFEAYNFVIIYPEQQGVSAASDPITTPIPAY